MTTPVRRRRGRVAAVGVALVVIAFEVGWVVATGAVASGWVQLAALGIAAAVLVSRWQPTVAMATLILGAATAFGPATALVAQVGPAVGAVAILAAMLGACWVTCELGIRTDLRWSVPWLAGWVAVVLWRLDADVPLLMLTLGWWAVGQAIRAHQVLVDRLGARAAELRREQDRFATEAVRLERARIARELHDVVAHGMTVIVIQARAGQQLLEHDPAATQEALAAVTVAAAQARSDVAALAALMDPERARPLTRRLLDELVERARGTGTTVELTVRGDPDTLRRDVAIGVHRAVQEALTNAFRYAPGAEVAVELDCAELELRVVNGPSPTPGQLIGLGAGRGLPGLTERLAESGLRADWGPTADGGWQLRVVSAASPTHRTPRSRIAHGH